MPYSTSDEGLIFQKLEMLASYRFKHIFEQNLEINLDDFKALFRT